MKRILTLLISFVILSLAGYAIDGPKTTAEVVSIPCLSPTFIEVQVTVTDFNDVGSINNRLLYDAGILDFESVDFNDGLASSTIDYDVSTAGVFELGVLIYLSGGLDLDDGDILYTLVFSYNGPPGGGTSALTWPAIPEEANEYGDPNGIPYDKSPFNEFFINGSVTIGPTICNGPVTDVAEVTLDCLSEPVLVPVTVSSFNNVSGISHALNYDEDFLEYAGIVVTPAIEGDYFIDVTTPGVFILGFSKIPGISIADGDVLYTLEFNYIGPPGGGSTTLTWPESPSEANEYSDENGTPYYKVPFEDYFTGGTVTIGPFICNGPVTDVTEVSLDCLSEPVLVPVTVSSFNNVSGISHALNYDEDFLEYAGIVVTPAIEGDYFIDISTPGVFILGFSKIPGISIADGDVLYTLEFNYIGPPGGGSTTLTWPESPSEANEYSDENGTPYYKVPFEDYFTGGTVTIGPYICDGPVTTIEDVTDACPSAHIFIPVTVTDFTNVSGISHAVNYDEDFLQYVGVVVTPAIQSDYFIDVSTPGVFILGFSKIPGITLNDDDILYTLEFAYVGDAAGGTSSLTWTETPEEANEYSDENGTPYYKLPFEDYFINGTITVNPLFCPDITPVLTVAPNVMNGPTNFTLSIRVAELNNVPTFGLITVRLTKDPRWVISGTFSDPVWSYIGTDPNYHLFTTSSSIIAGGSSTFMFNATWSAGETTGQFTITSTIESFSGGEVREDNNTDAERLDYFIN